MRKGRVSFEKLSKNVPPGAWFYYDADGWQLGIFTRNVVGGCAIATIYFVWIGVCGGISIGAQIQAGHFHWVWTGFALLVAVISLPLWWQVAMLFGGTVILTVQENDGRLFRGIRNLGLTKKFKWSDIDGIEVRHHYDDNREPRGAFLALTGKRTILLGDIVDQRFNQFILEIVRSALAARTREQTPR